MIRFDKGIEYASEDWNPVTGCFHWKTGVCVLKEDCWAKRFAEGRLKGRFGYDRGFEPTLHEDRLNKPYTWKKPRVVATCFMGDLFGDFIPEDWIMKVLNVIKENDRHVFLLLTKNPRRYQEFEIPKNAWCGTTISTEDDVISRLSYVENVDGYRWLSLEPLLEDIADIIENDIELFNWVVVGAKSGKNGFVPPKEWVKSIIKLCEKHRVPVFLKDNLTNFTSFERKAYKQFPDHPVFREVAPTTKTQVKSLNIFNAFTVTGYDNSV